MPATTVTQQKLFGIALKIKRGNLPESYSPQAAKLADTMSEDDLKSYAHHLITAKPDSKHPPFPGAEWNGQTHHWHHPKYSLPDKMVKALIEYIKANV